MVREIHLIEEASTTVLGTSIVYESCCTCGIPVAMTLPQRRHCYETGAVYHCVLGHGTQFKKSEVQRLREELSKAQEIANRETSRATAAAKARVRAEKTLTEERKAKKNLAKRVNAGVCLHCHRSFVQLRRHMASKHSE